MHKLKLFTGNKLRMTKTMYVVILRDTRA